MKPTLIFLALLALAPAAFADGTQLYKWTDTQGVIHYSDKPPAQPVTDLSSTDMPSFPAQDPAALAARQAALDAQAQTAQKLLQTQLDQQAQAAAERRAQVQAELDAVQQPAAAPIYMDSAYVPLAYRTNLYVPRRPGFAKSHSSRPQPVQPAHTILPKPH